MLKLTLGKTNNIMEKEHILELIENKIQDIRSEISHELINHNNNNAMILMAQVNVLREIKMEIKALK